MKRSSGGSRTLSDLLRLIHVGNKCLISFCHRSCRDDENPISGLIVYPKGKHFPHAAHPGNPPATAALAVIKHDEHFTTLTFTFVTSGSGAELRGAELNPTAGGGSEEGGWLRRRGLGSLRICLFFKDAC